MRAYFYYQRSYLNLIALDCPNFTNSRYSQNLGNPMRQLGADLNIYICVCGIMPGSGYKIVIRMSGKPCEISVNSGLYNRCGNAGC
jgi:hypothetical protein